MPVDASIPLQAAMPQTPDLLGQYGKAQDLALNQQQLEANKLKLQEQQAEAEAFKGADFSTPEGRNAVLVDLMQKAPQAGMSLMKQFSEMDKNQAQAKHWTSQAKYEDLKTTQEKQKAIGAAALPAWNAYQKALKDGKPDQVARAEADKLMPEALSQLQSSGAFSSDEIASMPRVFDPSKVGSVLMSTGFTSKMIEDHLKEAQTSSAEATAAEKKDKMEHPEKYRTPREATPQLLEDPTTGEVKSVNPSTGEVKDIPGAKGLRKPGTGAGGSGNRNVQAKVALVQGASKNSLERLDELQKEFGNDYSVSPIFGDHPSGVMGKLADAAYRKVGMSTKQQEFDAQAGSFLDEAIPVFTGGLRGSDSFRSFLAGQLPQPGEDPKTRARKWDLFKKNIEGASSSFAKAYQSNPQYWGKAGEGQPAVTAKDIQENQADLTQGKQPTQSNNKPQARPNPGEVRGGYKFKGGDPNSQANWEKVQ